MAGKGTNAAELIRKKLVSGRFFDFFTQRNRSPFIPDKSDHFEKLIIMSDSRVAQEVLTENPGFRGLRFTDWILNLRLRSKFFNDQNENRKYEQ